MKVHSGMNNHNMAYVHKHTTCIFPAIILSASSSVGVSPRASLVLFFAL